jgi:hypothetical protein
MDNNFIQEDWKNITDPVLRKKAQKKAYYNSNKQKWKAHYESNKNKRKSYYEANKNSITAKAKIYYETNKNNILNKSKLYRKKNKKKIKAYRKTNENKIKAYREANKDKIKTWYKSNQEQLKLKQKIYQKINKNKINSWLKIYIKNKKQTDVQFKLKSTLRSRLNAAIKNNQKIGSAVKDLGCSIEELKIYLESKFQEGMSWDNWSLKGWHIDHIKPLASFDLTDRNQLIQAYHYTNLQPLWAKDNMAKSDKII